MQKHNNTINSKSPKLILAVTNDLATDIRVQKIAQTLIGMGFSVTMAGRKLPQSLPFQCDEIASKRFRLWFNKGALFYANYNIRLFFHLLFNRYDVVVANDLDTLPACFIASKLKRKPIVYDSHEYFTEVPELINRPGIQKIWEQIEKLIVPKLQHCYTVSPGIAKIYHEKYGNNFKLVRNLPKKTKHDKRTRTSDLSFPTDVSFIIYQGAINLGRGVEEAILAMKRIENMRLVIAGDGDKFEECQKIVRNENLTDKVIFTGRISPEELAKITPHASIGLSIEKDMGLNYRLALPNKLFNYIQAGIPVLASSLPEIKNIVKTYNVGVLIDEVTPEKIATGLKNMMSSPQLLNEWKENCEIAGNKLCWENEEETIKEIYHEVLYST
ncbi:MAG: glycosyltransferase [Prolixibacteraceae bacterium]|jgi:glycosyltransferase involved in cell wall biosynthesis|nr:glycosyltransferase [Prolixibacteraceae bacterium]